MTPNAPLRAAIASAKQDRLPAHMAAELARIGITETRPEPEPSRPYVAWKPTEEQPECPF